MSSVYLINYNVIIVKTCRFSGLRELNVIDNYAEIIHQRNYIVSNSYCHRFCTGRLGYVYAILIVSKDLEVAVSDGS